MPVARMVLWHAAMIRWRLPWRTAPGGRLSRWLVTIATNTARCGEGKAAKALAERDPEVRLH